MLKENLERELLVAWAEKIESLEAKQALHYIVGFAACTSKWICHPQWKGYLPDFRFLHSKDNQQYFSFVPSKAWLLFYIRKPAINSGEYRWAALQAIFPDAEEKAGEWRVRLGSLQDAARLADFIGHQ